MLSGLQNAFGFQTCIPCSQKVTDFWAELAGKLGSLGLLVQSSGVWLPKKMKFPEGLSERLQHRKVTAQRAPAVMGQEITI